MLRCVNKWHPKISTETLLVQGKIDQTSRSLWAFLDFPKQNIIPKRPIFARPNFFFQKKSSNNKTIDFCSLKKKKKQLLKSFYYKNKNNQKNTFEKCLKNTCFLFDPTLDGLLRSPPSTGTPPGRRAGHGPRRRCRAPRSQPGAAKTDEKTRGVHRFLRFSIGFLWVFYRFSTGFLGFL